jgi:hypothetical protein
MSRVAVDEILDRYPTHRTANPGRAAGYSAGVQVSASPSLGGGPRILAAVEEELGINADKVLGVLQHERVVAACAARRGGEKWS